MYDSGSRARLGELDSGAGLGLISPQTHELTPNFATHTWTSLAHWNPEPSRTHEPDSYVYGSQSWESAHVFVVKLIRARFPSQARRAELTSQTRMCMGHFIANFEEIVTSLIE
jgi:hypothetical protein